MSGWLVGLLSPLIWRSPSQTAQRLVAFAHAEEGSRIDLSAAAAQCRAPQRAARYLEHARDEARHTGMFLRRARHIAAEHDLPAPLPVRADGDGLFERLGEAGFLAFVHLGEQRAVEEFSRYVAWLTPRDPDTAAVFSALLDDERRHATYTRALLVALCGELEAARAIKRARWWERWRLWRRTGRQIARLVYRVSFLGMTPLLALLSVWVRLVRPAQTGWRR